MAGELRQQVASVCQSLLSAVNQLEGLSQCGNAARQVTS